MIQKAAFTEVEYPESDGEPMSETPIHYKAMTELFAKLEFLFAGREDVYVGVNMNIYYEEGQPGYVLSPDGFVAFGVKGRGDRPIFKTWEEGAFPSVVFEVTSKSTWKRDTEEKFAIYQKTWKVKEYFLFDPLGEYLEPPLKGYRMNRDGKLELIKPVNGELTSRELGLKISREGERLILRDAKTGKLVLNKTEAEVERERAEKEREQARADAAEAEVARLRAELAKRDNLSQG